MVVVSREIFGLDRRAEREDLGGVLPNDINEVNPQIPSAFQKLEGVSGIEDSLKKVTYIDREE